MVITATDFVFVYMILSPYLSFCTETEAVILGSDQSTTDQREDIITANLPLWNQLLTEQEKGMYSYKKRLKPAHVFCLLFHFFFCSNRGEMVDVEW